MAVFVVAAADRVYVVGVGACVILVPAGIPGPLMGVPMVRDPHSILVTVSVEPVTEPLNVAQGGTALIRTLFTVIGEGARPIASPG